MIYIPKGIHLNNFAHGKPNTYCKGPNGDPIATLSSVCCCLKTTLSMIWKITHTCEKGGAQLKKQLKKWKTLLEISSLYKCVPKITIICTVPEIE